MFRSIASRGSLAFSPMTAMSVVSVFGDVKDFREWFSRVLEMFIAFREFLYLPFDFLPITLTSFAKDFIFLSTIISLQYFLSARRVVSLRARIKEELDEQENTTQENDEPVVNTYFGRIALNLSFFAFGYGTAFAFIKSVGTVGFLAISISIYGLMLVLFFLLYVLSSVVLMAFVLPNMLHRLQKEQEKDIPIASDVRDGFEEQKLINIQETAYKRFGEVSLNDTIREFIVASTSAGFTRKIEFLSNALDQRSQERLIDGLASEGLVARRFHCGEVAHELLVIDSNLNDEVPDFLRRKDRADSTGRFRKLLTDIRKEFAVSMAVTLCFVLAIFVAFSQAVLS